ncbi:Uncharacterised protein [Legionella pneumophila]|nr:hypothetical protein LpnH3D14_02244 [Legionella pneumophila]CZI68870.1 Uncharacterised protein [Legionella pneumophila]CZI89096.1 Uncharacterised protein [Legionella pneumophila]CZJ11487.1 Uncharacterised protein [Legionella pneumophila]CZJ23688.1 Uncharacterised protein [Legionella pneumophila]
MQANLLFIGLQILNVNSFLISDSTILKIIIHKGFTMILGVVPDDE